MRIRVKVENVNQAADRVERASRSAALALAASKAVNAVTVEFNEQQISDTTARVNLTPTYVKSKTDLTLAKPTGRPRAEILTRGDLTVMGNFGTLAMIAGRGALRRDGPRVGLRNAGTLFAILRGRRQLEKQWFVLPLRRGTQAGLNGFGVFVRDDRIAPSRRALREGRAGKRHIYGPSPYSLFARQIREKEPQVRQRLADRALTLMGDVLQGEL